MGNNCSLCVRCSFGCPQNAISIGLLNNWKVNGAYDFTEIIADESLPFPFITKETKGIYAIYKEYYHELNAYLSKNNTSVLAEDFRA
jgi:ferredoxin